LFTLCSRDTYPSLKEIAIFLQEDIDINCTNEEGVSPLLYLVKEKNNGHKNLVEILQLLIQRGIKINSTTTSGWNVLLFLCRHYKKENLIRIIQILIQHGIEMNCKISGGWNSLHFLCLFL
jgi:ankyrin repeat protein